MRHPLPRLLKLMAAIITVLACHLIALAQLPPPMKPPTKIPKAEPQPPRTRTDMSAKERAKSDRAEAAFMEGERLRVADTEEASRAALAKYDEALPLFHATGNREREATLLFNSASVLDTLGEKEAALSRYTRALEIQRLLGDWAAAAETNHSIGMIHYSMAEYERARPFLEEARRIWQSHGDRLNYARALTHLGVVYAQLGDKKRARAYFDEALPAKLENGRDSALKLLNIGVVYHNLGDYDEALRYYSQALDAWPAEDAKRDLARTLTYMGIAEAAQGRFAPALTAYNRAIDLWREVGDNAGEASALSGLGEVSLHIGDDASAIDYFRRALDIHRQTQDFAAQGGDLDSLMAAWKSRETSIAIFYGKQAVNTLQRIREKNQGQEKELRESLLKSKESTYRQLAGLLISQGRLPEAEQVLALLKGEEYSGLLRRRDDTPSDIGYSPAEAGAVKILAQLADLGRERGELAALLDKKALDETGKARLKQIDDELMPKANGEFRRALDDISREAPETAVKTAEVKDAQALMSQLRKMGPGTVALYTIVSTEAGKATKGWVMLVAPAGDIRKAYEMEVSGLEQTVFELRAALSTPWTDPRPAAQKLYRMIFQTPQPKGLPTLERDLETYLRGQKDATLMWSLDGVLRYVPMAALSPDGEHYMIERYRNVVFTPASIPSLTQPVSPE